MKNTDTLAEDWLKQHGLNVKTFSTIKLEIVRAQMVAKLLLTEYAKTLSKDQIDVLHDFQRAAANGRKVQKITDAQCYRVMNMHTKMNRKLFRQHRKLQK